MNRFKIICLTFMTKILWLNSICCSVYVSFKRLITSSFFITRSLYICSIEKFSFTPATSSSNKNQKAIHLHSCFHGLHDYYDHVGDDLRPDDVL